MFFVGALHFENGIFLNKLSLARLLHEKAYILETIRVPLIKHKTLYYAAVQLGLCNMTLIP